MGFAVVLKILVKANLLPSLTAGRWGLERSMSSVPDSDGVMMRPPAPF